MVVLISFILGLSFAVMVAWIISQADEVQSVMAGQAWNLEGIGSVEIIEVLGAGMSYEGSGSNVNVKYRTLSGMVGYCNKWDIRKMGTLLAAAKPPKKQEKIEVVLDWAQHKKKQRSDNAVKDKPYVDAEIVGTSVTLYCNKGKYRKF